MTHSHRLLQATALLLVLLLGLVLGLNWPGRDNASGAQQEQDHAQHQAQAPSPEPQVLYWYDPMVPDQHFDQPGKSPFMDMDLVPKYAAPASSEPGVEISAELVQNLGMRSSRVKALPLEQRLEVSGQVQFNERLQAIVQMRAEGFVERAWPLAVGDTVQAGQAIAQLHIPAWLDAQNELLAQPVDDNPQRLKTLRARLQLLGTPADLIGQIERRREPITLYQAKAPISGVIRTLEIKTGMTLGSGQTLASINGLDSLWLDIAIPEAQAAGLALGDSARFYPSSQGAAPLEGHLEALLPSLNPESRTLTARMLLNNPEGRLKPGASGRVLLRSSRAGKGLFVPTEAVIHTGKGARVMLDLGDGRFRPTAVIPGPEQGELTQILQGLEEDQQVVTSGQFLLDSEASLLGLSPEPLEHQHERQEQEHQHEQHQAQDQHQEHQHHD